MLLHKNLTFSVAQAVGLNFDTLYTAQTKSTKTTRKLESQIKSQSEQFKRSQELLQEKTNEVQKLQSDLATEKSENQEKLARIKKQHSKEKQQYKIELGLHLKVKRFP